MRPLKTILLGSVCAVLLMAAPSHAVVGGTPDTAHPYVGVVGDAGNLLCTGSLVSPTVFVTAAHCITGPRMRAYFGDAPRWTDAHVEGTAHVHPGFCVGCGITADHDLAVIELDSPVAMPVYGSLPMEGATAGLAKKAELTIVGYGVSALWGTRPIAGGTRMAADVESRSAEERASNFIKLKSRSNNGGAACHGDSGGPTLEAGTHTILAVISWSATMHCTSSSYSYRLDTPSAREFLSDFVALP